MEILLAEDERVIRESLKRLLEANGYIVRAAPNGERALALYRERRPDLLLLDVMMPRMDGYSACQAIRRGDVETPVLFLTALDAEADELRGLGVGADLYISKTVSEEVLLARIASVARRRRREDPTGDFDFLGWRVEPLRLVMWRRDAGGVGEGVSITEREVAMLRWLVTHPGEVFSFDFLLTRFWGAGFAGCETALRVAMHRLREKLGADGAAIASIRGSGYVFRPTKGL